MLHEDINLDANVILYMLTAGLLRVPQSKKMLQTLTLFSFEAR